MNQYASPKVFAAKQFLPLGRILEEKQHSFILILTSICSAFVLIRYINIFDYYNFNNK